MNSIMDDIFFILSNVAIWAVATILFIYIRRMIKKDIIKSKIIVRKESKRNLIVEATVTKVENMIWKYSQVEDASLECEYVDQTGKIHTFNVAGVIGKFNVKVGDTVKVLVDPNEFSNYQILLDGIVE